MSSNSYTSQFSRAYLQPSQIDCPCVQRACQFAMAASAMFTGAALFVNLVEHPSRLQLDNASALKEWKEMYKRAAPIQAGLAVISGSIGLIGAYRTGSKALLVGSALILANWPFTLICIMPINKRLNATEEKNANANTREEIIKWNKLHAVRTVLGLAATGVFMYALSK